jgi:diaminohydroxyphosphoribosylaminopyrimidine deaminase/5-amino-6-(5-phosphoribosylamino)uracil reductase
MKFSSSDQSFMRRALELAKKAKGTTFPNPAVGAVIVDLEGRIVGEGTTGVCGRPHAEKSAIKKAGEAARGAVMYVTLEPCSHTGQTPPCVEEIIKAKISRVVVSVKDPNPLVNGKGLRLLKAHGVDVQTGLLAQEAAVVNEDFFWSITQKRPWITLKLAMTLDGRVADYQNGSKWITSEAARREVQEIRRRHSAIAVGKNTLLHDDPKLTARCGKKTYYPARIVFSSNVDIPQKLYFSTHASETRSIIVIRGGKTQKIDRRNNIEFWHTGCNDNAQSIGTFLSMAHAEGLTGILIEGGQQLATVFLENGFVNKVYLFYGNKILGNGKNGLLFSQGLPIASGIRLNKISHRSFGDDFLVSGYIGRTDSPV